MLAWTLSHSRQNHKKTTCTNLVCQFDHYCRFLYYFVFVFSFFLIFFSFSLSRSSFFFIRGFIVSWFAICCTILNPAEFFQFIGEIASLVLCPGHPLRGNIVVAILRATGRFSIQQLPSARGFLTSRSQRYSFRQTILNIFTLYL